MTKGDKIVILITIVIMVIVAGIAMANMVEVARYRNTLSNECQFLIEQMEECK